LALGAIAASTFRFVQVVIWADIDKDSHPPRSTKALAVETDVYDGIITSSPPAEYHKVMAAIPMPQCVEWVKTPFTAHNFDLNQACHFLVNSPLPERWR